MAPPRIFAQDAENHDERNEFIHQRDIVNRPAMKMPRYLSTSVRCFISVLQKWQALVAPERCSPVLAVARL
jgi:hypothetical protein